MAPQARYVPVSSPLTRRQMHERGKYLVAIMACGDCHTPHRQGRPLPGLFLSGHPSRAPLPQWDTSMLQHGAAATISPYLTAFAGPFGVSVAGNLTPDKETGIGRLTADGLVKSWKTGRHWRDNRMVLPPMPMSAYRQLTVTDIKSIHTYLMALKPVRNAAPRSLVAPVLKAVH